MKTNLIYPLLVLLLLNFSSKAQFESINLNKYKLANFKYKSLSTSLNANSKNQYTNSSISRSNSNSTSNSNYNEINSGGNLEYSSTTNNRNYYGIQNVRFNFNNNSSYSAFNNLFNDTSYSSKLSWYSSNFALSVNSNNLFYLSNDLFIGINLLTAQLPIHKYSKSTNTTDKSTLSNYFSSNNEISFQFGKGRIEDVSDARLAIYILDDLAKQGRLSHTPSQDEVFAFADFITKTLNKRVIDNRIKRIKEYVAVDSFLVANGLTTKTDGLYFGLINDNWNYARLGNWETGSRWHFGISPSLNYQNSFNKIADTTFVSKIRSKLFEYGLNFDAEYRISWISGLKWLKGYVIGGEFELFKYDSSGYYPNFNTYKSIAGNAKYFITYIPNTRTSITCGSGIMIIKYLNKEISNRIQISPNILGSCSYYFSEKLRFQISANLNYNYSKVYDFTMTSKTLSFQFNAALQYYIF